MFHHPLILFLTSSTPDFLLYKTPLVLMTTQPQFLSLHLTFEESTINVNSTIFWMILSMITFPLSVYKKLVLKNLMQTACSNHLFQPTTKTIDIEHIGASTHS